MFITIGLVLEEDAIPGADSHKCYRTKTKDSVARDKSGSSRPDRLSNNLVYGPYTDLPPFAEAELDVHYVDPEALLVAKEHRKNAVISHWSGQLAVQEDYEVHHKGAR